MLDTRYLILDPGGIPVGGGKFEMDGSGHKAWTKGKLAYYILFFSDFRIPTSEFKTAVFCSLSSDI